MLYLNLHQLLNEKQSRSRFFPDTWLKAINGGNINCWLCFSRLSQGVIQNLKHYEINKLSLAWFESFLSNRSQQEKINTNQFKLKMYCVEYHRVLF